MEEFGILESSENTIAILGDRWWPQTAKQEGDVISKQFLCSIGNKRTERPNVGGVSIRSWIGAPSRKGCMVNDQLTQASNNVGPPRPLSVNQRTHLTTHMLLYTTPTQPN